MVRDSTLFGGDWPSVAILLSSRNLLGPRAFSLQRTFARDLFVWGAVRI